MSTGAAAVLGIVTGFVILIVILCLAIYNKLDLLRNALKSLWSDIEGKLKKRYDLIPALLKTVRDSTSFDEQLFKGLSEHCSKALRAPSPADKAKAEHALRDALSSFLAVAVRKAELAAHADFTELQRQIKDLEDSTDRVRARYNNIVRDYNAIVESFPSSMLAALFKFERAESFELEGPESSENRQG